MITENLMTPLEWQAQGMAAGTPFALAHTFGQTGPFRPSNVERRLPGMFFAGSGTVPGVGVPMVLISGKLAASRVADIPSGAGPVSDWVSYEALLTEGYRAVRQADLALRHHLLLGRGPAAQAAAQARICRLRPLPAGRRHC